MGKNTGRGNERKYVCTFCGTPASECNRLFQSDDPNCFICDACVETCHEILREYAEEDIINSKINKHSDTRKEKLLKPSEIKAVLDDYVIGQDDAKKTLSVAVYNHYKRINAANIDNEVEIEKSNILLLGPTGSGKCVCDDTMIKIRNKQTKQIEEISIKDFKKNILHII